MGYQLNQQEGMYANKVINGCILSVIIIFIINQFVSFNMFLCIEKH